MEKQFFADEEEVRAYENELATDPENWALCRAHVEEARANGDQREWGYRLLAFRMTAIKFKSTADSAKEFGELETRQKQRWIFYSTALKARRTKMEKLRANPNYKTPRQRKDERERLLYIRWCLRTGTPITWPTISMVWDKSRGHAVAVRPTREP